MTHRYIGRNRNAGYGYSYVQRLRRHLAFWLGMREHYRLAYLIDFDRDRYREDLP